MIDEKRLQEAKQRVSNYLQDGTIKVRGSKEFTKFFFDNAQKSLQTAKTLYDLTTSKTLQEQLHLTNFDASLWVINSSYYSMFYTARALLESQGIEIKTNQSIHAITFDALTHFFYLTGKLQKHLIEEYAQAQQDANELLGQQEAEQLLENYYFEKEKRATFTYHKGQTALPPKAKTSLTRAQEFNQKTQTLIPEELLTKK